MGDLSTKNSDTHSYYGTRIQTGHQTLESQKIVKFMGKWMSGRSGNPGWNTLLMDQDTGSCKHIQHMLN